MNLKCPKCKTAFSVAEEFAGRQAKCPSCEVGFVLPMPADPTPSEGPDPVREVRPPEPGASVQAAIKADTPEPGRLSAALGMLLAVLAAVAAGFGLWWLQGAALSPTDTGFEPRDSIWAKFIGRFHPIAVHLPIGVLTLAGVLEGVRILLRRPERFAPAVTVVMWTAAAGCVMAMVVGYLLVLDGGPGANERLLGEHIAFGQQFAAVTFVALLFWHAYRWFGTWLLRWSYRLALVAALGLMAAGAHYGGAMVYGPSYLTRNIPPELRPLAERLGIVEAEEDRTAEVPESAVDPAPDPALPANGEEDPGVGETPGGDTVLVYQSLVEPVFALKCMECHEEGNAKGRLRMDSYAELMAGGSMGPAVVAGSSADSEMIFRLTLPLDDDERMPPPKKEQLTEAELALLLWWVDSGASEHMEVPLERVPAAVRPLMSGDTAAGLTGNVPPDADPLNPASDSRRDL